MYTFHQAREVANKVQKPRMHAEVSLSARCGEDGIQNVGKAYASFGDLLLDDWYVSFIIILAQIETIKDWS